MKLLLGFFGFSSIEITFLFLSYSITPDLEGFLTLTASSVAAEFDF